MRLYNNQIVYTVDVIQHNKVDDLWIIIDGKVFGLSKFVSEHSGGAKVPVNMADKDFTKKFE